MKKAEIQKLEDFYINGKLEDLIPTIEMRKKELIVEMVKYAKEHEVACKWDKDGCPIDYKVDYNPVSISYNFFKPIIPFGARIPMYNTEKMCMVYDYYMELIAGVNENIGAYPPTLTGFAKFAGLSLSKLRDYKNSAELDMRIIMEKIYDEIGESNLTFSQLGKTRERTTLFRLKSENELVEKNAPNVNITYKEVINTDKIDENLDKYKKLLGKKD